MIVLRECNHYLLLKYYEWAYVLHVKVGLLTTSAFSSVRRRIDRYNTRMV